MSRNSEITVTNLQIQDCIAFSKKQSEDNRGTMTRIWSQDELYKKFKLNQGSYVSNPISKTLRGLHYQDKPFQENKIVQCISGRVFDVIVDLRENSKSYRVSLSLEIGPNSNYQGLFIPSGCAHGYITLEPDSNLIYYMDNSYSPDNCRGIIWNDSTLGIKWPFNPVIISKQDLQWPELVSLEQK